MGEGLLKTAKLYDVIEVKLNDAHPHAYKPHLHSELAIGVIERGDTVLTIDGVDYEIHEGDAVIIMPYVIHNCQPVDINTWAFTMIYLDDAYKDELLASIGKDLKIGISKLGSMEYQLIKRLAGVLKKEHDDFVKEVEIIDCINRIIDAIDISVKKRMDETLEEIQGYIEENFLEELRLDAIAAQFDINKFSLIRRFKKVYNITPSAYQLQLKVDHAKQLLKQEDDIAAVSLEAGFYDQAHFAREFKKATGMTPKQYMESVR